MSSTWSGTLAVSEGAVDDAASEGNPFARANTVTFPAGVWTRDISHGAR
ncbi:hypothetical protein [Streptomyces griseus]|nr:hypothetical protein [Streptomyces griseus]